MSFVCKAEAISYGRAALEYAEFRTLKEDWNEETEKYDRDTGVPIAHEVCRNKLPEGLSPEDCVSRMQSWNEVTGHGKIKSGFLWISINPSEDTCEKLDNGKLKDEDGKSVTWEDIVNEYMRRMHLDNTMFVAVMHDRTDKKEKGRKHIHILACRTTMDEKLIKEHNIGIKSKKVAEGMDDHYGLTKAKNIKSEKKDEIRKIAIEELKKMPVFNIDDYTAALKVHGLVLESWKDKKGNIKGYTVYIDNDKKEGKALKYKLSQIDRRLTASHIENTHEELRLNSIAHDVLNALPEYSFEKYKEELHNRGVDVEIIDKNGKSDYRIKFSNKGNWHESKDVGKEMSLRNLKFTYKSLHQKENYDPKAIVEEMGIKKIIAGQNKKGQCWIKAILNNGHLKKKQIDINNYWNWQKHKITTEQLAINTLLKNKGRVSSSGTNREWEVGVEDEDYEKSTKRSMGLGY